MIPQRNAPEDETRQIQRAGYRSATAEGRSRIEGRRGKEEEGVRKEGRKKKKKDCRRQKTGRRLEAARKAIIYKRQKTESRNELMKIDLRRQIYIKPGIQRQN